MRALFRWTASAVLAALLPIPLQAAEDNYQGLWWNPAESGWGLNIAQQRDVIMATWLAYDATSRARWLTLWASRSADGSYAGTMYESTRPGFATLYDPPQVGRQPVGQATIAFGDTDHGTFRYKVRGVEGARAIARQVFGALPQCTHATVPDLVNATNYTDTWWAAHANEPGWNVSLAHQGEWLFATWATYDYFGAPTWLVAAAPRIAGNVYGGTLYRTTGPDLGAPFDPALVARTPAGTATFTFSNGNAATFAFALDGVTGTKALTRELFEPSAGTRCRDGMASAIQGRVFAGEGVAATVCADVNGNGRCDGDEPATVTDPAGAYTLATAGFTGPLVAETFGGYRMLSPGRDYSANITPYTTLVQLAGEPDLAIAEMMVRNELGLPQRFRIKLDAPPAEGSLAQSVARLVVGALKASQAVDAGSLARVVALLPPELVELPQIHIRTKDGAPIDSKEVYVDATFEIMNAAAANTAVTLAGKIRGRGNYTWQLPKKPYKVQIANDAAYAALPDVLGMTKNRNWALLADYADRSLMRNQLVFTLGNSSLFAEGLKWTPATVRLELWLNGRYDGLYTLTEDVRVDPARLDIARIGASDLDGGYLVEVDMPLDCYNDGTINLQHLTPNDVHVCVKTPDETAATSAQLRWIKDYIDAAETDLYAGNSVDKLNLVSYVDWYLVNEYIRNWDGPFFSSDYMWKDSAAKAAVPADRLLNMGPLWDFDISAGNANFQDLPQGCWIVRTRDGIPNWYTRLRENPEFVDLTVARWKDKQAALGRLTDASITAFRRRIEAAAARNTARWLEFGPTDWSDAVAALKGYLVQRRAWMGDVFATSASYSALCK